MSDYNKGDMLVIELDHKMEPVSDEPIMDLWLDVYGHCWAERELEGLDRLTDDFINDRYGILQEYAYQQGIKAVRQAVTEKLQELTTEYPSDAEYYQQRAYVNVLQMIARIEEGICETN